MTTKTNETKLAEHEIRLNTIEKMLPKIDSSLNEINRKLDEHFVTAKTYDRHQHEQDKVNKELKRELDRIFDTMMTQEQFKDFSRSQLWQKIMTGLGGAGITIITGLVIYALTL